jgi:nascent polypeptide-associated complex subunit alpha
MQAGQNEVGQFGNPVNPDGLQEPKVEEPATTKTEEAPKNEEPATEDDLNEEGLSADNIKMVMEYTKCTKAEAIRALRETDDDSVNAIMKLTK